MTLEPRPIPPVPPNSWSALDRRLSTKLFHGIGLTVPRKYLMLLEHSGNGLVWLFAAIALLLLPSVTSWQQKVATVNFLIAFVVDLILVGTLKSIFRRPRPVYNASGDFILVVSVDQYSFPSGHASRASFVSLFVCLYAQHNALLCCLVCLWGITTAASRAVMGRHYVGDVCAGISLGVLTIAIVTQGLFHPNGFLLNLTQCQKLYGSLPGYLF